MFRPWILREIGSGLDSKKRAVKDLTGVMIKLQYLHLPKFQRKLLKIINFGGGYVKHHTYRVFLVVETPNGQKIQREHKIGWAYLWLVDIM